MFLLLHNPEPNGTVRVQAPEHTDQWTVLGVGEADELLAMAAGRPGAYIGIDLSTGDVADVFAYSLAKRTIPHP